jgi:hypothetical protein
MGKQNSELSLIYEYIQSAPALIEDAAVSVSAVARREA